VLLISDALWRGRFGGDPAIVGRTVQAGGVPSVIVGVMPPDMSFRDIPAAIWRPLALNPDPANRQSHGVRAIGRLADGATLSQASAEMSTMMAPGR
jgi:hypothetical protein